MPLVDISNPNANWYDVLEFWSRIANWTVHKPNERQLTQDIRAFAIALWSERDWLIAEYPDKRPDINAFINKNEVLSIVAEIANTSKHRILTRARRSNAEFTEFRGQVTISGGATRQLHYIRLENDRVSEIMPILRQALECLGSFRIQIRLASLENKAEL